MSLIGESLGPGTILAGVNTVVRRPSDTTIGSTGTGTGSISIVALRLVSEAPVTIGSSSLRPAGVHLRVQQHGHAGNGDLHPRQRRRRHLHLDASACARGSSSPDRAKGTSTVIDCGAVTCGTGGDVTLRATNIPFTISGGPGNFQPSSAEDQAARRPA